MSKIALAIIFFSFASQSLFGQVPTVEWQKCLGGKNGEYASSVEPTTDGGYIVAGFTEGDDNGDIMGYHGNPLIQDFWVVKLDKNGSIQWRKCIGGAFSEKAAFIRQTTDGGYIVAGSSASQDCEIIGNHGGLDYWVIKLKPDGDIEWQKMLGGNKNDYAWSIDLANDGGYFIAGHSESTSGDVTVNYGNTDYWVIKIDGIGNLEWQKTLGGSGEDQAYSVKATPDGGCVMAGYSNSNDVDVIGNHGKNDFWITKLSNTGNLQWQKSLGGTESDAAWSIQLSTDGGYVIAGLTTSNNGDVSGNHNGLGPGDSDYWVVKLNSSGAIQWQKCYGGDRNEIAYFMHSTPDGGYVIAGSAESANGDLTCNSGATDLWLIKINNTGALQWQKNLGGNYYDEGSCIKPTNDGGFIVCGNTCSSNIAGYHSSIGSSGSCGDYWIIKLSDASTIIPNPIVTINQSSATICAGLPSTITTSALYTGTNPTYRWERNGITVGGNNSFYTASDFSNNDVVKCFITQGGPCETNGLQSSDVVIIKINNNIIQPGIAISADNTVICPCTQVTFKATVFNGGASPIYQWKLNGLNTGVDKEFFISNNFKSGDIITCVYSDNSSCIVGGSIISNPIQISGTSGQSPTINISASNNNNCIGTPINFIAAVTNAGTRPVYQWKINGVNAGTNSNIFSSSTLVNGDIISCVVKPDPLFTCVDPASISSNNVVVSISNSLIPSINITSSANSVCPGAPITFIATPLNAGTSPSYQWMVNGVIVGTNNNIFTTTTLNNSDIINCKVIVDPLLTCFSINSAISNNITITLNDNNPSSVNISASANDVCKGTSVTFIATPLNAGTSPSYQWMVNNRNVGSNSPFLSSNSLSNGDQVVCEMTPGANSCLTSKSLSNTILMSINNAPSITIFPTDTTISPNSQLDLNAVVSGTINSHQWTPSNQLRNPFSLTPTTFPLNSNTIFTLSIISDKGCSASKSVTINIKSPLLMPNAFTPNNDGLNDIFRIPKNVSFVLKEFSIYDRWGNKIFSTENIEEGWKGNNKGLPAPAGVYVYMIKGADEKGSAFLKGTFVLIR